MKISSRSKVLGATCISACLALGGLWYYALDRLAVGGPLYSKIIDTKDIVADILPPPLYIIEPYLDATLALNEPSLTPEKFSRSRELMELYQERQSYWLTAAIDKSLATSLTVDAYEPARQFWSVLAKEFYPALIDGSIDKARSSYEKLSAHYADHRVAIDRTVELANANGKAVEALSADEKTVLGWLTLTASLLVLGLIFAGIVAIVFLVSKPMDLLSAAMGRLASGDLEAAVPCATRSDELGEMARAVIIFRDAVRRMLELEKAAEIGRSQLDAEKLERLKAEQAAELKAAEERENLSREGRAALERVVIQERDLVNNSIGASLAQLADGDLTQDLRADLPEAYSRLKVNFNRAFQSLRHAISDVALAVSNVDSGTCEISSATVNLARRVEHQAASLEEATAALRQLSLTLDESTSAVDQTDRLIDLTDRSAQESAAVVGRAGEAMKRIAATSSQITTIISIIDEIAFQTNLLALNAGVEASRAGEAGRGFAVVASEVRALAQRSAVSAHEVKSLVEAAIAEVEHGVSLVRDTNTSLSNIATRISELKGTVKQVTSSSRDQKSRIQEIGEAVARIDLITQENSAIAEQTSAATQNLTNETRRLEQLVDRFKIEDQKSHSSQPVAAE